MKGDIDDPGNYRGIILLSVDMSRSKRSCTIKIRVVGVGLGTRASG